MRVSIRLPSALSEAGDEVRSGYEYEPKLNSSKEGGKIARRKESLASVLTRINEHEFRYTLDYFDMLLD